MEKSFVQKEQKISNYVTETFKPEDTILKEVKERTKKLNIPLIQLGGMDGLHLEVFIRMTKAKKIVEIGTLAGYSGICIARGIQNSGILHTIDIEKSHFDAAAESFKKADVAHLIKQHLGKAIEVLHSLEKEAPFDAIFIDADKNSYPQYLAWAEKNLKIGGIIIADNTFAWGHIADTEYEDAKLESDIKALREFNFKIANNPNFKATILPTGEGMSLAVKIA